LLYSVVIQAAERATVEICTSSMSPFQQKAPKKEPMYATGLDALADDAELGPLISDPFL
jgi:hypothetical protein